MSMSRPVQWRTLAAIAVADAPPRGGAWNRQRARRFESVGVLPRLRRRSAVTSRGARRGVDSVEACSRIRF